MSGESHPHSHATPTLPQAMTAKGIESLPVVMVRTRCRGNGGGEGDAGRVGDWGNPAVDEELLIFGPREMTKVICADCGQDFKGVYI